MDQDTIFLTILGMAVVTYVPRLLPMWLLSSKSLPPLVIAWLRYVPVAALSALLLPALVVRDGRLDLGITNLYLWAAIPTVLVAWKTHSFFGTVLTGVGLVALVRFFLSG